MERIGRKRNLIIIAVTALLIAYQLARIVAFVQVYGGVEHDGGWMLSISRSLAEQGRYTTMVSTLPDPAVTGAVGVDEKFDIQAADGRIWFFTGNGIGPASIIPDALVLKLFGTGFWALRTGPLLFYTLFLILAAYILYRLAGPGAILLFHAYLFFYPHLSIFLSYEAMGEVPAIFYILAAYLVFAWAMRRGGVRAFFGAGLAVGLALSAKLIALWSVGGIFVWAGLLWLAGLIRRTERPPVRLAQLIGLGAGAALPLLLWELVHLLVLTRLTSFALYRRHLQQRWQFILDDGSGVGLQIHSGPGFFWDKFFLLGEIAHLQRWITVLIFAALLLGGAALLWRWRDAPAKHTLFAPMWFGWLLNTAWFVGLAKTGWPRHFWFGLVLAIMLLPVIAISLIRAGFRERRLYRLGAGLGLLILVGWGFVVQPHVGGFFLPDEIVPYWRQKQINNKYDASLPWIIIPRADQAEAVDYIRAMPPEARVYYPGQHKSAEIPAQTGRVQYPMLRRPYMPVHPADVVLIGPSLISPWKDPVQRRDLLELVERECPRPAVKNDFYMICPIEENLSP